MRAICLGSADYGKMASSSIKLLIGLAMLGPADAVVEKLKGGLRMIDDT